MLMRISHVSERSGCPIDTIRYYERIGLIPQPARQPNGYREYCPADVERLGFIIRARDLGFHLEQIRSLLELAQNPALSCQEVDEIARHHLHDIRERIRYLQRMDAKLEDTIEACRVEERGQCTILAALNKT